jgi:radical SAM protein with 4Fe4S-binding SPASM domain
VRLGISLDGSCPEIHDTFRGLSGAFVRTIQAVEWAGEAGLPIQVHTTISRHNAHDLDNLCNLFEKLAIVMWNVFFLVPVGRGQLADLLSGDEFEQVFGKIYELSHRVSFQIKTTEAMHYRRYLLQHNLEERRMGHGHGHPGAAVHEYEPGAPQADPQTRAHGWATRRVNDGKGFMFISHVGNVYPSGFLPIHAGNVRESPLADIYREAPIFKALRDTGRLEGKCGACEYKEICGGSRARAYALTGDPLAQEPCCIYQPRNWTPRAESEPAAMCQPEIATPLVTLR